RPRGPRCASGPRWSGAPGRRAAGLPGPRLRRGRGNRRRGPGHRHGRRPAGPGEGVPDGQRGGPGRPAQRRPVRRSRGDARGDPRRAATPGQRRRPPVGERQRRDQGRFDRAQPGPGHHADRPGGRGTGLPAGQPPGADRLPMTVPGTGEPDSAATGSPVPVVAVVGRPNVGKSTLVNRILGSRQAVVEDTPGVTRDRVAYDANWRGRAFTLVDTGGWDPYPGDTAHASRSLAEQVTAQARMSVEAADAVLFVVDAVVGITDADEAVAAV